jgi:CBS domain-containing protein
MIDGDGELLAIVTDRDLCMAACREGLPPDETPVASMATYGVLTVRENESIEEAELLMRRHHIRRLPVVDAERRPIGIISLYDLAQHAHWAAARGERPTPESVVTTEVAVGERPAPPR